MIIKRQVIRNLNTNILKINQFIFIYNLLKKENIINYNFVKYFINVKYFIKI